MYWKWTTWAVRTNMDKRIDKRSNQFNNSINKIDLIIVFLKVQNIFSSGVLQNYLVFISANKTLNFLVAPNKGMSEESTK